MPRFPAVHRLVTTLALGGGFALVGIAAGGVQAVDADLERAALKQRPVLCDQRVSYRPGDATAAASSRPPCRAPVTLDRDAEL